MHSPYSPPPAYQDRLSSATPGQNTEAQREIRAYLRQIAKYLRIMCILQMDDQHVRQLQTQYNTLLDMDAFTGQTQKRRGGNAPLLLLLDQLLEKEGE